MDSTGNRWSLFPSPPDHPRSTSWLKDMQMQKCGCSNGKNNKD